MRKAIEVRSKDEGNAIEKGLENPELRAIVIIEGVLSAVQDKSAFDGAVNRVLDYINKSWASKNIDAPKA